jgi:RNA polymerase sigma factor (sigma-70 family)
MSMARTAESGERESLERVEKAYTQEKPRLVARLKRAGKTLQDAEDLIHDSYAEVMARLALVPDIRNLPAWINSLIGRRMIDAWRRDRVKRSAGEVCVAEETLEEIIAGVGFDPLDGYVRDRLLDALDDAIKALPPEQRFVVEAQVFGGKTFREISEATGESIDALTARKRYALDKLAKALRHWIED